MSNPQPLYSDAKILIVDDDASALESTSASLRIAGYRNVVCLEDSRQAMELLERASFSCILLDLCMPHLPGNVLLPRILERYPDIPVIVVTAMHDLDMVVSCMRDGAHNYLTKPLDHRRLLTALEKALRIRSLEDEVLALKNRLLAKELKHPEAFKEIVTGHSNMKSIFAYLEAIARTPYPKLITGESGTGKELIARSLYRLSGCSGEFAAVNVSGLDDALFSDALFGHKKGAFTGADSNREGLLSKAIDGVVFLDEIGDMGISAQVKLLRLFQECEYQPLGSDRKQKTNARFIVATNRDLEQAMHNGKFRQDLYYRLNTHSIHIPPLRERLSDLPILIKHFIRKHAGILGKPVSSYPPQLMDILGRYHFPGNVRELENLLADAVAVSDGNTLPLETIKKAIKYKLQEKNGEAGLSPISSKETKPVSTLKEVEEEHIASVLQVTDDNIALAAKLLGIGQTTLYRKVKKM